MELNFSFIHLNFQVIMIAVTTVTKIRCIVLSVHAHRIACVVQTIDASQQLGKKNFYNQLIEFVFNLQFCFPKTGIVMVTMIVEMVR